AAAQTPAQAPAPVEAQAPVGVPAPPAAPAAVAASAPLAVAETAATVPTPVALAPEALQTPAAEKPVATGRSDPAPAPKARNAAPQAPVGAPPARGGTQTVAHLAAQIVKKLEGRSTRFDLQLDPLGLGKVDVRVEIGAGGKVSAAMSCDNPQAAAELRSRAG